MASFFFLHLVIVENSCTLLRRVSMKDQYAQGHQLLCAEEIVFQPPVLRAIRLDVEVQTPAIRLLVRLFLGLCAAASYVGQFHQIPLNFSSKYPHKFWIPRKCTPKIFGCKWSRQGCLRQRKSQKAFVSLDFLSFFGLL